VREKIEEGDDRKECGSCGRRFSEEAFPKHVTVCEKVFMKKRKEFSAQDQRTIDAEHRKILGQVSSKMAFYENSKLNTKWKIHSAQFRNAIISARTG